MTVRDFRLVRLDDPNDRVAWENWSRCYEYPLALRALARLRAERPDHRLTVHNTACGASPLHTKFARELDRLYDVTNSDVEPLVLPGKPTWPWMPNYRVYNLMSRMERTFDAVLCISTLEHIEARYTPAILQNLFDQTAVGGLTVLTVDVPVADVAAIENFVGRRCARSDLDMDSTKSVFPAESTHGLAQIGYLEVERDA